MPKIVNNPVLGWVAARHLQHAAAHAGALGVRVEELLAEGGLEQASLADADGRIPLQALEDMLEATTARYADPLLGLHLASDIQPATYGVIGHLAQACTTLSDTLEVVTRYNGLLSNIGKTSLVHGPGSVQVRWDCLAGSAALRRQLTEYVLGSFAVMVRILLPEQRELMQAVHFAHARPAKAELARQYFEHFRCPVYFDKPAACFFVGADAAKIRLHHGDVVLKEVLERHAQNLLRQRQRESSLAEAVRQLVAAMMVDGAPTREMVSMQLGLSGRSLHRKLEELGSSYREILDGVRLEIAQAQLQHEGEPLGRIAERLGFRSRQALLRWYKHSTGMTPGEHRRRMAAGPA
ncbi:MAG: AraC family transcriptional regulator [Nevskia sp.]|nr:AraC family transcriptional regulator [Nevskia sp.]